MTIPLDASNCIAEQIIKGNDLNGMIHLIQRVTYLSVETMKIIDNLPDSLGK